MVSDAKKRAINKYKRERCRTFTLRFFPADMGLYEHLRSQPRMAEYVKGLIRDDISNRGLGKPEVPPAVDEGGAQ